MRRSAMVLPLVALLAVLPAANRTARAQSPPPATDPP